MFYLVFQSKRHKFIILELKFEDLIIHNTVKIKRKTDYCREVRHNYNYVHILWNISEKLPPPMDLKSALNSKK